jgi:hypothetical protein
LTLGSARFELAGGHATTIRISLKGEGLSRLRKAHALMSVARVVVSNPQGRTTRSSFGLTLHYPTKKRRRGIGK